MSAKPQNPAKMAEVARIRLGVMNARANLALQEETVKQVTLNFSFCCIKWLGLLLLPLDAASLSNLCFIRLLKALSLLFSS